MAKVLILGAGASHGHGVEGVTRPPLAGGFFSDSQFKELLSDYQPLFDYLQDWKGIDLSNNTEADVESIFERVEPTWSLGIYEGDAWQQLARRFGTNLAWVNPVVMLRSYIIDLLLVSSHWLLDSTCPYHDFLATQWLRPGDTVISFNYDLIMDCSLSKRGDWSLESGYGTYLQPQWLPGHSEEDESIDSPVKLLKLHGSLNWYRFELEQSAPNESTIQKGLVVNNVIREILVVKLQKALNGMFDHRPDLFPPKWGLRIAESVISELSNLPPDKPNHFGEYIRQIDPYKNGLLPLMIMPSPNKSYDELKFGALKRIWRRAWDAIEGCDEVFTCGFSFRDQHFVEMMQECSLVRKKPIILKVITKDSKDILHINAKLSKAKIEVIYYMNGWLSDFAEEQGYSVSKGG